VRDLQRLLARTGYAPGPIDGRYGPRTEQAVRRFQADRGLQVDGIAGRQTLTALTAPTLVLFPGAGDEPGGSRLVRDLQRLLARTGYAPGPIDGRFGPRTEQAVRRFQANRGLQVDGIAGRHTFVRLRMSGHLHDATHAQPGHASTRAKVPRASRRLGPEARASHPPGSLPVGWVVTLGALGLGLVIAIIWYARRDHSDRSISSPEERREGDKSAALEHDFEVGAPLEALKRMGGSDGPYRGADEHDEADAAFNLGVLLEEQHDLAGAEAAYRRADKRGHAPAASNLGVLLEGQGDLAGAKAAYGRADERGEPNGAFNLGVLLEEHHDLAGAEAAYRRADERGHAKVAQMARAALLDLPAGINPRGSGDGNSHDGT
jgi:peptidoglycan hydrolase-like protein with peptidoglycan-binding domain